MNWKQKLIKYEDKDELMWYLRYTVNSAEIGYENFHKSFWKRNSYLLPSNKKLHVKYANIYKY